MNKRTTYLAFLDLFGGRIIADGLDKGVVYVDVVKIVAPDNDHGVDMLDDIVQLFLFTLKTCFYVIYFVARNGNGNSACGADISDNDIQAVCGKCVYQYADKQSAHTENSAEYQSK